MMAVLQTKFAQADRLLLINLLYLGDLVFSLPLLQEIKRQRPDLELTLLANHNFAELPQQFGFIDRVIPYNKNMKFSESIRLTRSLSKLAFPLSLNIHGSWRTTLLQRLIKAEFRAGYSRSAQKYLLDHHVQWGPDERHMVDYFLDWLDRLGLDRPSEPELPRLELDSDLQARPGEILSDQAGKAGYVILNTGGSWPSKRWPVAEFVDLTVLLVEQTDRQIVFTGGSGDKDRNALIIGQVLDQLAAGKAEDARGRLSNTAGSTSITELLAVIAQADLMISGDTGPVHLAALLRTPALALFGPSDEVLYRPYGKEHLYPVCKNEGLWCRPCGEKTCPLKHHKCLVEIPAREVWERASLYLT
ncbi:MAG: glycosyltransferase family 9 protein [Bacillota bacterium]